MSLDLSVMEPGVSLRKSGGTLELRKDESVLDSIPLHRILSLSIGQGVSLSSDLILALAERGAVITVHDASARPGAILHNPLPWKDPRVLRGQALALYRGTALPIARALLQAKLTHQQRLLHLWARNSNLGGGSAALQDLAHGLDPLKTELAQASDRDACFLLEAHAARVFWSGVTLMVPFRGRRYPKAQDLTNQLLNYGYGVLSRLWLQLILQSSLDPHMGVLHADRTGRPGLVLDLMEPWRPWVDRTVVGLLRQGVPLESQQGELTLATRMRLLDTLQRAFRAHSGKPALALRAHWLGNTRQLAVHFGDGSPWRPFLAFP